MFKFRLRVFGGVCATLDALGFRNISATDGELLALAHFYKRIKSSFILLFVRNVSF